MSQYIRPPTNDNRNVNFPYIEKVIVSLKQQQQQQNVSKIKTIKFLIVISRTIFYMIGHR